MKTPILSAIAFSGTLAVLSVGYAALNGGLSASDKVLSNAGLSSASWNRIVDGILDLDARTNGISSANGNIGIGTITPGQKLSVAGIVESTSGGFKFPDGSVQETGLQVIASGTTSVPWSSYVTAITGLSKTEYYHAFITPTYATTGCGYIFPTWGVDGTGKVSMTLWNNASCGGTVQWKIVRIK